MASGRIVTITQGGKTVKRGLAKATAGSKVDKRHLLDADGWAGSKKWVLVKSSWCKGIMYDAAEKRLYVEFKGAPVLYYPNQSIRIAKGMFNAPSLGKFVHRYLYDKPYVIVG